MAGEHDDGPDSLSRSDIMRRALSSLDAKYLPGFWTWARENKPEAVELINFEMERLHETDKDSTDATFLKRAKRWWGRIASCLQEYREDKAAQETYKSFF